MLTLLGTVLLGILFAVWGTENTAPISLNFGSYILPEVPTYLAVLVPLLIGLLLGFFSYVFKDLSQKMTINEDKGRIKNLKKDLAEVTQKSHKFEIENAKLKNQLGTTKDEDSI